MATLAASRNPLATVKPLANHVSATIAPWQTSSRKLSSASKRAHSPDPGEEASQSAKRARAAQESSRIVREDSRRKDAKEKEDRDRRRAEREDEFRTKYSRAFPNWIFHFYFDADTPELDALKHKLQRRVEQLGARTEDFFQRTITHLIVLDSDEAAGNKENSRSRKPNASGSLASPIKLKASTTDETRPSETIKKAMEYDIKVWDIEKLSSVLDRCQGPPVPSPATPASISTRPASVTTKDRQLSRLLQSERLHGTTERDPTQRRHDYVYFSKGSYYVLVEDMRQEIATVAAVEYPIQRTRDGKEKGSWPVLHCHPHARGPFIEYNEREERRRQRADQADKEREEEVVRRKAEIREQERRRRAQLHAQAQAQQHRDLRRAVSMQNLCRQMTADEDTADFDAESPNGEGGESAAASGYLASGAYVAASGNSVSITSATGTTSTAGASLRSLRLPPSLRDKIENQVVTSRKVPNTNGVRGPGKENLMGPPLSIPDHPQRMLRKSKSTTTMRLAKRDEGMKPGYCECCRVKFEDFKQKHRKFADDDANFAALDIVLSRVTRRTLEELEAESTPWDSNAPEEDGDREVEGDDEDAPGEIDVDVGYDDDEYDMAPAEDDVRWNEILSYRHRITPVKFWNVVLYVVPLKDVMPIAMFTKWSLAVRADQKVAKALTELENCGLRALTVPKVGGERIAVAGGKYRAVCRAAFSLAWAPAWECGRMYKPTALAKLRNPSFVRTSGELVPDIMT
ncbi:hypothetical protein PHLGIDRAFT_35864 [Phlebiopsis gigantea 11061_1 CR5-6]|uniref:DBF4-type domain-containing protein n=1 Tax=Phlebiopsis gigantea (strain 11061_1 CR5-6) TaxID=745531 RepID=A0A0C3NNC9_PHLG1|nr:hypothetical protein PHLGIDRAFT_35864 [Phlebiopsis gigantea 11061_1 CR5-6]